MNKKTSFFPLVIIVAGVIGTFLVWNWMVSENAIPSLSEYMASSTPQNLQATTTDDKSKSSSVEVGTPRGIITVDIINDPVLQEKGLGGRKFLSEDDGMLFVFDNPGIYGFWMKDMEFPIDIVWIGPDKIVISVSSNVATSTYPEIFLPSAPASYVLEINSGSAERHNISAGTKLEF